LLFWHHDASWETVFCPDERYALVFQGQDDARQARLWDTVSDQLVHGPWALHPKRHGITIQSTAWGSFSADGERFLTVEKMAWGWQAQVRATATGKPSAPP
jgi:hypothetical protein